MAPLTSDMFEVTRADFCAWDDDDGHEMMMMTMMMMVVVVVAAMMIRWLATMTLLFFKSGLHLVGSQVYSSEAAGGTCGGVSIGKVMMIYWSWGYKKSRQLIGKKRFLSVFVLAALQTK